MLYHFSAPTILLILKFLIFIYTHLLILILPGLPPSSKSLPQEGSSLKIRISPQNPTPLPQHVYKYISNVPKPEVILLQTQSSIHYIPSIHLPPLLLHNQKVTFHSNIYTCIYTYMRTSQFPPNLSTLKAPPPYQIHQGHSSPGSS